MTAIPTSLTAKDRFDMERDYELELQSELQEQLQALRQRIRDSKARVKALGSRYLADALVEHGDSATAMTKAIQLVWEAQYTTERSDLIRVVIAPDFRDAVVATLRRAYPDLKVSTLKDEVYDAVCDFLKSNHIEYIPF